MLTGPNGKPTVSMSKNRKESGEWQGNGIVKCVKSKFIME